MNQIYKRSLIHSLSTVVYIIIVAALITNGEKIFGQMKGYFGPIAFLMLFALSALVLGCLILGKPLMLYVDGKKAKLSKCFWPPPPF